MNCSLQADGEADAVEASLGEVVGHAVTETMAMQTAHVFSGPGTVAIDCKDGNPAATTRLKKVKLSAVKVGEIAVNSST